MHKSLFQRFLESELVCDCRRLYGFGVPHWKIIMGAIFCMVIYTALTGAQLALVKPVLDKLTTNEAGHFSVNVDSEAESKSAKSVKGLYGLKEKTKNSAEKIGFVKKLIQIRDKATQSFTSIGIMAAILAPFIFLSFYGQRYFSNLLIWGITRDIRNKVCEHLLPQPLSFFENKKSGELISKITNDITTTNGAVNILFSHVLLQPMKLVFGLALAFYFNWKLALLSFAGFPLIAIPVIFFGGKVKKHSKSSLQHLADLTDIMREMFSGIRIVKAYSMEDEEAREIHDINQSFFRKRMKSSMARATSNGSTEFIYGIGLAVVVILSGYIINAHKITTGELGGFITAIGYMVYRAIKQLSKSYNSLQDSLAGATRVFELLDYEINTQEHEDAEELKGINDEIAFNNVSFGYSSATIIKNVSFKIKKGSIVGIVGQSGAGKSTLLNLILRFYDTTAGNITIDGKDIRSLTHKSLLDHIALVTQQTFLFNRSIEDNIRYGSKHSSRSEIENASKAANIHDFIINSHQGYGAIVGEMGVKLSGGQRQRIAIARAFLKNAPILILDEATSSLDTKAEQSVQHELNSLMKGKTTLVVAHRLTTVKDCDKILVLKDGDIVETGTHDELIEANGEYCMLYRMQSYD